jgi:hypothetical protein
MATKEQIRDANLAASTMFNLFPQGAFSGISSAIQRAQGEPMMADSGSLNLSPIPIFPKMGPLVRTDYGSPPSERPDWRDPSQQWDARTVNRRAPSSVGSGRTISQADAIAQNNANMSPEEQAFYRDYMARMEGGGTPPPSIQPQRLGFTTPYGMVYPTRHQLGQAQQLSESRPMSSRLSNVGERVVRPKVLKSRIDYVKENTTPDDGSTMRNALEGLTQAEKIRVMKERGKQLAKQRKEDTERFFASKQSERREETETIQKSADKTARKTRGGGQTRQRSWSNYTGDAPIRNFDYENA